MKTFILNDISVFTNELTINALISVGNKKGAENCLKTFSGVFRLFSHAHTYVRTYVKHHKLVL